MAPASPPAGSLALVRFADREAEGRLRQEVREEVDRLLRERQLLSPTRQDAERVRAMIRQLIEAHQRSAANTNTALLRDPAGVEKRLYDDIFGLGPLQPLLDREDVEEIIVNGPGRVFCIQNGEKRLVPELTFESDEELQQLIKRLIGPLGKRLDVASPMVDARLPDGSRLNAAIPPVTTRWTALTIRRFRLRADRLEELIELGTLTEELAQFLDTAVQARVNLVVSGATGAGKTTLLNCLGSSIASSSERAITIEEVSELQIERHLPDCVALQARGANVEGAGEVRIRDLVRNALRMRPSRIIVGEVRGPEALDMLLAMNSGHAGSLTSIHADSPRDALERMVTLAMMAEEHLTGEALTRMVARTIEVVVQLRFDPLTNRRRVSSVFEVTGMEGNVLSGNELWTLDEETDRLVWTRIVPRCATKFRAHGLKFALPATGGEIAPECR